MWGRPPVRGLDRGPGQKEGSPHFLVEEKNIRAAIAVVMLDWAKEAGSLGLTSVIVDVSLPSRSRRPLITPGPSQDEGDLQGPASGTDLIAGGLVRPLGRIVRTPATPPL